MRSLLCHPKSERDRSRWPRMLWDALEALIARVHRKPPNCKRPRWSGRRPARRAAVGSQATRAGKGQVVRREREKDLECELMLNVWRARACQRLMQRPALARRTPNTGIDLLDTDPFKEYPVRRCCLELGDFNPRTTLERRGRPDRLATWELSMKLVVATILALSDRLSSGSRGIDNRHARIKAHAFT
jgi:hypothetical protein